MKRYSVLLLLCVFLREANPRYVAGRGSYSTGNLFRKLDKSICQAITDPKYEYTGEAMLMEMKAIIDIMRTLIKHILDPPENLPKKPVPLAEALISRRRPSFLRVNFNMDQLAKKFEWGKNETDQFWEMFQEAKLLRQQLHETIKENWLQ